MKIINLGDLNDTVDALMHENNVSPFYPHSDGYIQINCHSLEGGLVAVETSPDGDNWTGVRSNVLPAGVATDRSYTAPFYKMNRYIRVRGQNITAGKAECFLVGG